MYTLDDLLDELLVDSEFKKEWDDIQPEIEILKALSDARLKSGITQKELAKKCGISQGDISKIEHGKKNPSIKLLQRIADGMNMRLEIKFVPK